MLNTGRAAIVRTVAARLLGVPTMKDKKTGKKKANRASGAQGKPDTAQTAKPSGGIVKNSGAPLGRKIPVWVDESEWEDFNGNFDPSPLLYTSACAFIWAETHCAINGGDNDLLSRDGIADALGFISSPYNAESTKEDFNSIFEDWKIGRENHFKYVEKARNLTEAQKVIRRVQFFSWIDKTKKPDCEAMLFRRLLLSHDPYKAGLLGTIKELNGVAKSKEDKQFVNKLVDGVFEGICEALPLDLTQKGKAASDCNESQIEMSKIVKMTNRVRAEWLNGVFAQTGELLAEWINAAVVEGYRKEIGELRERIADNYGIFPAPFGYSESSVEIENYELRKLFFLSRAMSQPIEKENNKGKGITIAAFAKMMGVNPRTVRNWLSGNTTPPTVMGVKFTRDILKDRAQAVMFAFNYRREIELNKNGCIKSDGAEVQKHLQDMAALKNGAD